jgi:hypothetical protein
VGLKPEGPKQGRLAGRYVGYGNGGGFTVKKLYCMKDKHCVYLYIVQVSLETMAPIHRRQGIGIQNYRRQ